MIAYTNTAKNQGFTVIELILFIAISALMLIVGISSISGRAGDVQFSDSIRTLESQLRRNLSSVGHGLNLRGDVDCVDMGGIEFLEGGSYDDIGRNRNCVANGVELRFNAEDYYTVSAIASLAEEDPNANPLDNLNDLLAQGKVGNVPGTEQDITYKWQTKFIGAVVDDGSATPITTSSIDLLRLRAVNSSSEYLFVRAFGEADYTGLQITPGTEYALCFEGDNGKRASINIGEEARFVADFTAENERCDSL